MNRLHDLMSSSEEGRRRLAAARLRREVLVNLESALEESGMTQSALASALGRTRSAVNQVFGGDGNIRISTLAEYLHAMGQELVLTRVPEGATRARLWRDGADTVAQTVMSNESSDRWSRAANIPTHFVTVTLQERSVPATDIAVA
jgi:transcriptional regulator with XRE-family HTH domain